MECASYPENQAAGKFSGTVDQERYQAMEADSRARIKLTYEDYMRIPEDGRRHEIVDGEHKVNPAPGTYHQTLSRRIQFQLYAQVEEPGLGAVFDAPVDLQLSDSDVVQPDLVLVLTKNRNIITPAKIKGVPDLVVEILSQSTATLDRQVKKRLYQASRIPEYWLVDPDEHTLEQYCLEGGRYTLKGKQTETVIFTRLPDVSVDLGKVW